MKAIATGVQGAAGLAVWCLVVGWWWKQLEPDDWPKSSVLRARGEWSERVRRLRELDTTLDQIRDLPEVERSA